MMRVTVLILLFSYITFSYAQDAKEIVRIADKRMKGNTSYALLTLKTIRPSYSRELTIAAWTKGDSLSLIRILSPAKDKGTAFLRRNKEVWNWIPSIERTIKLPPSMMSQSWMGTDFTNDDLVKEASIVKDYEHRIKGETTLLGLSCYEIELIPKAEAAVVWGKIILYIDRTDYMLLKAIYYDEDGGLSNTMTGGDIGFLGGRKIPRTLEMQPEDKPGNKTVMIYRELRFNEQVNERFFTPQQLQQER